jgi:hypothetical protein
MEASDWLHDLSTLTPKETTLGTRWIGCRAVEMRHVSSHRPALGPSLYPPSYCDVPVRKVPHWNERNQTVHRRVLTVGRSNGICEEGGRGGLSQFPLR